MRANVRSAGEAFFFRSRRPTGSVHVHVDEAFRACAEFMAEAETAQERLAVLNALSGLNTLVGNFEEARAQIREARLGFEELGMTVMATSLGFGEGLLELTARDYPAAEQVLRAACDGLRRMGETAFLSTDAAYLGLALYRLGRLDEADAAARESEQLAAADDVASQSMWRFVRALVLARRGGSKKRSGSRAKRWRWSPAGTRCSSSPRDTATWQRCCSSRASETRRGRSSSRRSKPPRRKAPARSSSTCASASRTSSSS